jgi:hypothetical protein
MSSPHRYTFKVHKAKILEAWNVARQLNADMPEGLRVADLAVTSRTSSLERVELGTLFDLVIESNEPLDEDFLEHARTWGNP